jgi:hypothetical protein
MLLLTIIILLLSPLRLVLEDITYYTLPELLSTDAITADLNTLADVQADLFKFARTAKTIHTKHLPTDHSVVPNWAILQ